MKKLSAQEYDEMAKSYYLDVLKTLTERSGHSVQRLLEKANNDPKLSKEIEKNKLKGKDRYLNWENVKILGDLKILTKASYLILLFVPLLSGMWPTIIGIMPKLSHMPSVWGWSFIAALLVIIGHLIYEIFAHAEIKKYSRNEFALNELTILERVSSDSEKNKELMTDENLKQFSAALSRYNKKSISAPFSVFVSGLFYIISVVIVLGVVCSQTRNVLNAVGGHEKMFSWIVEPPYTDKTVTSGSLQTNNELEIVAPITEEKHKSSMLHVLLNVGDATP